MAPPSSPALQQLLHLDASSSDFDSQLNHVLHGQEYRQCLPTLQGDDVAWLVDYLDKVLDVLDPSSPGSRKCLRELRSVCGAKGTLPTSYIVSSDLLDVGPDPFTSGGYGDVYLGTLSGSRVYVKRVRIYVSDGPEKVTRIFCKEAVMWKRLTHPNIVPLLGITITPLQLISSWMPGGNLPEYIQGHPDADRLGFLLDVAKGLCYLHSYNAVHGDIKGSNVFVDESGHACIADFGVATITKEVDSTQSTAYEPGLTPRWTAPEILNGESYTKAADVFSFAMLMIEVFTGKVPYYGSTTFMAVLAIMEGKRPPRPTHPAVTENLWQVIQRCWNPDPPSRPEATDVLQALLTSDPPAWKQLISHPASLDERINLLTSIFPHHNEVEMARTLSKRDAQAFVDVLDEMLDSLPLQIRERCLYYLYTICSHQALVPRSLEIPLCYNPEDIPHSRIRLAEVWKGRHNGQDVAVEVLKMNLRDNLDQAKRMFCREVVTWRSLQHPNVLPLLGVTVTEDHLVMVSEWMNNGDINEFLEKNTDVDRLELLRDVAEGLVYMHDQGVIHGDLKGANIVVDNNHRARLAGFSQITLVLDQQSLVSSSMESDELPWMSPELIDPETFGLKDRNPTRESDCYALGMVVYEVLSGQAPFAGCSAVVAIVRVLNGQQLDRPEGERGELFTDEIWAVLGRCWESKPSERATAKEVLRCLEGTSSVSPANDECRI